ncbi:hypothetical protein C9439_01605 [archaeon SCG-AAA382B04]|nr:hypothetical protein C9439_01605 [archaeon SCG-AAA382B04]
MPQPSFYETIEIKTNSTSINLENDQIEEAKTHQGRGIFARALVNGNWGFASSASQNEDETIKKATKQAKINQSKNKTKLAQINPLNQEIDQETKIDPSKISPQQKIELLKEAKEKTQNPSITNTKFSYSDIKTKFHYKNSQGSDSKYRLTRTGASAKAVAKEGSELQSAQERVYGTKGYEIFEENNFLEKSTKLGERAKSLLDAHTPPSGKLSTILDPELAGVFIHEAVGHAAEGDLVSMNNSILKDKVGQKIGNEIVTIKDDPSRKGLFGYYPFDWEGVESEPTTIVKDGELKIT